MVLALLRISSDTATHCNTLQHTATHCNTLPHAATHCNRPSSWHYSEYHVTLQHTATHCTTLQQTIILALLKVSIEAFSESTPSKNAIFLSRRAIASLSHWMSCQLSMISFACVCVCVALCCSVFVYMYTWQDHLCVCVCAYVCVCVCVYVCVCMIKISQKRLRRKTQRTFLASTSVVVPLDVLPAFDNGPCLIHSPVTNYVYQSRTVCVYCCHRSTMVLA